MQAGQLLPHARGGNKRGTQWGLMALHKDAVDHCRRASKQRTHQKVKGAGKRQEEQGLVCISHNENFTGEP